MIDMFSAVLVLLWESRPYIASIMIAWEPMLIKGGFVLIVVFAVLRIFVEWAQRLASVTVD